MASASDEDGRDDGSPPSRPPAKHLVAEFTRRDAALYALGVGCCDGGASADDGELRFAYERHPRFAPFPTFLLALPFVARRPSDPPSFGMRPFPPESMTNGGEDGSDGGGILPRKFLRGGADAEEEVRRLPLLHMSQSLTLHDEVEFRTPGEDGRDVDPPTQLKLRSRIVSIKPRSVGTFVTSETEYHPGEGGGCIATAEMVTLILGLDPDDVAPLEAPTNRRRGGGSGRTDRRTVRPTPESSSRADARTIARRNERSEKTEFQFRVPENAALLYRLSGDYNAIHVEADLLGGGGRSSDEGKDGGGGGGTTAEKTRERRGAVLHGLCTMGYALRAVLRHADEEQTTNEHQHRQGEVEVSSVRCNFVRPVYVGDRLRVEVWDEKGGTIRDEAEFRVCFRAYRCLGGSGIGGKKNDGKGRWEMVVDKGKAQLRVKRSGEGTADTISRL